MQDNSSMHSLLQSNTIQQGYSIQHKDTDQSPRSESLLTTNRNTSRLLCTKTSKQACKRGSNVTSRIGSSGQTSGRTHRTMPHLQGACVHIYINSSKIAHLFHRRLHQGPLDKSCGHLFSTLVFRNTTYRDHDRPPTLTPSASAAKYAGWLPGQFQNGPIHIIPRTSRKVRSKEWLPSLEPLRIDAVDATSPGSVEHVRLGAVRFWICQQKPTIKSSQQQSHMNAHTLHLPIARILPITTHCKHDTHLELRQIVFALHIRCGVG